MENLTEQSQSPELLEVSTTIHPLCFQADQYYIVMRFWLNVVLGATLSLVSIAFNCFIFTVFITSKQHRNSYNLFLLLLAMFDVFMGLSYISVLSTRVLINWTLSYWLKKLWVSYMIPMLTVSHIAITGSTYLITFAAIERYCITVNNKFVSALQNQRKWIALAAVLCGVISKGTILQEIEIQRDTDCIGTINEWAVMPSKLVQEHELFNKIWRFYFRNIFTILAPFFILLLLNAKLIYRLHSSKMTRKDQIQDKQSVKQKKARIRAATRTLVIIVCTYLMSNLLAVIITIWEYFWPVSLKNDYTPFYVLSVDWISLFTIVASCLRLPVYVTCQPLLRAEMKQFIAQLWTRKRMSRRMTLIENNQLAAPLKIEQEYSTDSKVEFV